MVVNHRQLRQLELELRRRYRLPTSGRHLGKASGFGIVPDGAKPYEPGDPPALIDWHATARTGELIVRKRQIEHYARALVVVDYSARQVWGGGEALIRKSELSLATADALTNLLVWQGDRISLLLSGSEQIDTPMLAGTRATKSVRSLLATAEPSAVDQLANTLANLNLKRRMPQMIIVISDFLSKGWEEPLRRLAHRHEVIAVQVLDPWDLHLPDLGRSVRIGEHLVDTRSAKVRQAYDANLAVSQARRETFMEQTQIRHLLIQNNQPLVEQLVHHLAPPNKRRAAS